jgi:hypothetical protein
LTENIPDTAENILPYSATYRQKRHFSPEMILSRTKNGKDREAMPDGMFNLAGECSQITCFVFFDVTDIAPNILPSDNFPVPVSNMLP